MEVKKLLMPKEEELFVATAEELQNEYDCFIANEVAEEMLENRLMNEEEYGRLNRLNNLSYGTIKGKLF